MLPPGWAWTTLGEMVEFSYGKGLREDRRDASGSVPVYGSNGMVGMHSVALVDRPCIVVGRKGSAGEVHVARVPSWPIDTTYYILPPHGLHLEFLNYLLKTLSLGSLDRSSAIPGLNRDDAYAAAVSLPPFPEQRRIVAKIEELFSQLDAGVEELKKAKAQLKRYGQSVLKAAFEGKLTEEWRKAHKGKVEPAPALLERIKTERKKVLGTKYKEPAPLNTSDLHGLPEGWAWARLDAIAAIKGGITKDVKRQVPGGHMVPYLRVANVQRGYLDLAEVTEILASKEDIADLRLRRGDVLFTEGGDRDKLGRGWVWQEELPLCIHQNHVFRARLYMADMQPKFVSRYSNIMGRGYFMGEGKQTTNLASINMTKLSGLPVAVPPAAEQAEIVDEIEEWLSVIDAEENTIEAALKQAARLRQSILKRAFEGRLVPQDPSDPPASELLVRIRAEREESRLGRVHPTRREMGARRE